VSARPAERGAVALATAIVLVLVAAIVGAAVGEIARTELVLAQSRRTLARGLAAADACLADVVSTLPAGWDHAPTLAGADAIAGTADDGLLAAPSGCRAVMVPGPLGAVRPFLDVAVTVAGGGRRLRAIVGRDRDPVPSVVWSADGAALGSVAGRLRLDGVDAARPDLPPLRGLTSPDDPAVVDAWLAATPNASVAAGSGPPAFAPPPPLPAVATRMVARGALPTFTPTAVVPSPALHVVFGDLAIASAGTGAGILYVDGRLDIDADFAFSGIVAVRGGIHVASGVGVRIAGGLWLDRPGLDVAGDLLVQHDRAALDAASGLLPFPRRAAIAGLVDR
jgi:hypothetical protein